MFKTYVFCLLTCVVATTCSPSADEAVAVNYSVFCDGTNSMKNPNDQGWSVKIDKFEMAVKDLEFTVEGEIHASLLQKISDFIIPSAYAHPGHQAGGEITGEMTGTFILDIASGSLKALGEATLIEGAYHGFNLYFATASTSNGLNANNPLVGHSIYIEGVAVKENKTINFTAALNEDDGTHMVGGIFNHQVKEGDIANLNLRIMDWVELEGMNAPDSIFDGIDFGALDEDNDGKVSIEPGQAVHNIMKKEIAIHDYYYVDAK